MQERLPERPHNKEGSKTIGYGLIGAGVGLIVASITVPYFLAPGIALVVTGLIINNRK